MGVFPFALCLSHDVDRVYKTYQYIYEAVTRLDPDPIRGIFSMKNPYWQFERIMDVESSRGVRSSFNVLVEKRLSEQPWPMRLRKKGWQLFAGRYDVRTPEIASTLRVLDRNGWEIGLHGSYTSSEDPNRFAYEKDRIEAEIETEILGNRQHYWRLSRPETWRDLRAAGIKYDTSLGDSAELDSRHGYALLRPFEDEFVVFPWSVMDAAVMDSGDSMAAVKETCDRLLERTRDECGVLVLNWHQNVFNMRDYPGWTEIYAYLIERAQEMGAWVGPPGKLYQAIPHPDGTLADALNSLDDRDTTVRRH